ncbi:MAG TPA: hypothetical protein VFK05_15285 [Polyangiaceae bacterium]|nr:hypothetical protein [Polyangiaceae bacterium]
MTLLRLLLPALLAFACSASPNDARFESTEQAGTSSTPQSVADSKSDPRRSAGSESTVGGAADTDSAPTDDSVSSGAQGVAGADSAGTDSPPRETCDLGGSCLSDCEDRSVTCGVAPSNVACEFQGFTGATAEVSCNRRVVIGTACCGACGCVPVEVYFDGTDCWQGIPECKEGVFSNRMLFPHEPTTPNPSFTLPTDVFGSFYLGTGGFAGLDEQSSAGTGSGGTGGSGEWASAGSIGYAGGRHYGLGPLAGAGAVLNLAGASGGGAGGGAGAVVDVGGAGGAGAVVNVGGSGGAGAAVDAGVGGGAGAVDAAGGWGGAAVNLEGNSGANAAGGAGAF